VRKPGRLSLPESEEEAVRLVPVRRRSTVNNLSAGILLVAVDMATHNRRLKEPDSSLRSNL